MCVLPVPILAGFNRSKEILMSRIQDPLLEDVLHLCSLERECVFLDTSLPGNENYQFLLFVKPVSRVVCREGVIWNCTLNVCSSNSRQGTILRGGAAMNSALCLKEGLVKRPALFRDHQQSWRISGFF